MGNLFSQIKSKLKGFAPPEWSFLGVMTFLVVLTRWLTRSEALYHWDSVQFALAIEGKVDLLIHQPHPPGYIFYVYLGKAVNFLTDNAHLTLILISIFFSVLALLTIYQLAKEIFSKKVAYITAFLFLADPLIWFHGSVGLTYILGAFFASLVALLAWRFIKTQDYLDLALLTIILGMGAGFRPTLLIFLFPLWLFAVHRSGIWTTLKALGLLLVSTVVWVLPTVMVSGGFEQSWDFMVHTFSTLTESSTQSQIELGGGVLEGIQNRVVLYSLIIGRVLWISLGLGLVFAIIGAIPALLEDWWEQEGRNRILFFSFWIIPALAFFVMVFFTNAGYLLAIYPALIILASFGIIEFAKSVEGLVIPNAYRLTVFFTALVFIVGASRFLLTSPTEYSIFEVSHGQIKNADRTLKQFQSYVRDNFSPQNTVILPSGQSIHMGYRHMGYYLPEFEVIEPMYPHLKFGEWKDKNIKLTAFKQEKFLTEFTFRQSDRYLVVKNSRYRDMETGSSDEFMPDKFVNWFDLEREDHRQVLENVHSAIKLPSAED